MNGFEFLSVVRRRFPTISVIAISGEFSGLSVPESVLADAFFSKGQYQPPELFQKILELLEELPTRPREGKPKGCHMGQEGQGDYRGNVLRVSPHLPCIKCPERNQRG